jgi:hypothetical protein
MISLRFPNALLIGLTLALAACARDDTGAERPEAGGGSFSLSAERRAELGAIGGDTLSEAAQFLSLLPEADGDAIVFTFADSARGVSSGLGIIDRRLSAAQLLWPDSVTRAWWLGPHSLAFATHTGAGVRVVVDVHAAELEVVTRGADSGITARAPRIAGDTIEARARATRFLDSVRVQPGGQPDRSQLRYRVISLRTAPGRAMGAFYAAASDSTGARTNPAWYFIDYQGGQILPIDEVTGPISELPETAAAWSEDGRFIYVKGRQIHEAKVTER